MHLSQDELDRLQPHHHYPASIWYEHTYRRLVSAINDKREAGHITTLLLEHYLDYTLTKHILSTPIVASTEALRGLYASIQRLEKQEPIQYILGSVPFLNYRLRVTPHVFIPRTETEQMVAYIIDQGHDVDDILDLCTGSGCIAIALKKAYPNAQVDALDVHDDTLEVARKNAKALGISIHWFKTDLLKSSLPSKTWDLMVSNPPYIPMAEKKNMADRVLHYEPHRALFVPDDNPLVFYERIAVLAEKHLNKGGYLYLEVHEEFAQETADLLCDKNLQKIRLHKDFNHKNRWLSCHR